MIIWIQLPDLTDKISVTGNGEPNGWESDHTVPNFSNMKGCQGWKKTPRWMSFSNKTTHRDDGGKKAYEFQLSDHSCSCWGTSSHPRVSSIHHSLVVNNYAWSHYPAGSNWFIPWLIISGYVPARVQPRRNDSQHRDVRCSADDTRTRSVMISSSHHSLVHNEAFLPTQSPFLCPVKQL